MKVKKSLLLVLSLLPRPTDAQIWSFVCYVPILGVLFCDTCAFHDPCGDHATACDENLLRMYTCTCEEGWTGRQCNVPLCNEGFAYNPSTDDCVNCAAGTSTFPGCACSTGFERNALGICVDIDECESPKTCNNVTESCVNSIGSYECLCKAGFASIGGACRDVNECAFDDLNSCDRNTTFCKNEPAGTYQCISCANENASPNCACPEGYRRDDIGLCVPFNECAEGTHTCADDGSEVCVDVEEGTYECLCADGFSLHDGACEDRNECLYLTDDCNHTIAYCKNTPGSFECISCADNNDGLCDCGNGYRRDGEGICINFNECLEDADNTCDKVKEKCQDTDGSYKCEVRRKDCMVFAFL